jgi:hypothetical protein
MFWAAAHVLHLSSLCANFCRQLVNFNHSASQLQRQINHILQGVTRGVGDTQQLEEKM